MMTTFCVILMKDPKAVVDMLHSQILGMKWKISSELENIKKKSIDIQKPTRRPNSSSHHSW